MVVLDLCQRSHRIRCLNIGLPMNRNAPLGTLALAATLALAGCGGGSGTAPAFDTKEALGEGLFFDENLSRDRTQSCATCHNPEHAFIDDRVGDDGKIPAVSLGDDGTSLGDRNAPTAAYAKFSPDFHIGTSVRINSQQPDYVGFLGGQFLDGRELDLKGQAGGPPLNPVEMNMPDKASVVERIKENPDYIRAFESLYDEGIFDDVEAAYAAMAESIAIFEKTDLFSPFDSKYDRSLLDSSDPEFYELSFKELTGKALFFSQQFTNCATCHQLHASKHKRETFSSYEYHNIGVPPNDRVRLINGKGLDFIDNGLFDNPAVTDEAEKGKYKVPTLRNVAVTEPYMHNGVFRDLETVVKFYDHFLVGSLFTDNPETGAPWRDGEVTSTINFVELQDGRKMSQQNIGDMVCFLRTLTDARYEDLIESKGIECSD